MIPVNTPCSTDAAAAVATAIRRRRSVRIFDHGIIPKVDLDSLVQAGIDAPSGSNWQNQRFLVIDDPEEIMRIGRSRFVWPYKSANLEKVKGTHPGGILGHAAALVIVFSDSLENDRRGNGEYHIWQSIEVQNCSASIENILILATAMGLGSCWVSASDQMNYTRMFSGMSWRRLFKDYELPLHYSLQGIVLLGHPRSADDLGYPKGESMHGATVWQSTKRREIDYYLVKKRNRSSTAPKNIGAMDRSKLRLLSGLIQYSRRLAAWADKRVHRIEIEKHLKPDA